MLRRLFLALSCLCALAHADAPVFRFGNQSDTVPSLRIVGDRDYAPVEWLEDGRAKGIIVSTLPALAETLQRNIEYRLLDWKEAQAMVLAGEADVLTVFSPNERRIPLYDFVPGLLNFEMSLFVPSDNLTIHDVGDLNGIKVGVPKGSFLLDELRRNSAVQLVELDDHASGFRMLLAGELAAVATTKWVGAYTLQKEGIQGIKIVSSPILVKGTHFGIKKGNDELALALGEAVRALHRNGTVKRLARDWEKQEIVYLTQESLERMFLLWGGALVGVLLLSAILAIALLRLQVRRRTASLEAANQELARTLNLLKVAQNRLVEQKKISALGNLVAGMAHELNTPLGNAVMMSSHIEATLSRYDGSDGAIDGRGAESLRQANELVAKALHRLVVLIDNFRKISLDRVSEQRREFDLLKVVHRAVALHLEALSAQGVTVDVRGERETMTGFPDACEQIVDQLLCNAAVHAFVGRERGQLRIEVVGEGDQVRLRVRDDGVGVANDELGRLFDPFYTTRLGKGSSGLGLHVVYTLVTGLLGGEIRVASENGLIVDVILPRRAPERRGENLS